MIETSGRPAGPGESRRPALCLVNRHARSGDIDLAEIADILAAAGLDSIIRTATDAGEMAARLREEGPAADVVVIGGGDGTISALLPDLLALDKPIGILPLGTANDLAGSLAIPRDLEEAAAVIAAGHIRRIDLGRIGRRSDDRWFVNVATVGFGTEVARAHQGLRKKLLGVLAYPFAWLDAYRFTRPFTMWLTLDGRTISSRCVQITIGSGTRHGGGLMVSDQASHDDGLLWIYYVKPIRLFGWLRLIPALLTGRHRKGGRSVVLNGKTARLETSRPMKIDVDGDIDGDTPAEFSVHPGALSVFAPPPTLDPRN